MSSSEARDERVNRRSFLRSALVIAAVGAGVALGAGKAAKAFAPATGLGTAPAVAAGGSLTVSVNYYGMPLSVTSTKQESFTLQSPADFHGLLEAVVARHPLLSAMIPTMIISVNGTVAKPATPLRGGDVVDLVPAVVGG